MVKKKRKKMKKKVREINQSNFLSLNSKGSSSRAEEKKRD